MLKFNVCGCKVCVSGSFFSVICLVLLFSNDRTTIISLFSAFLHESGHIAAMIIMKEKIKKISFTAVGIYLEKSESDNSFYEKEAVISLSGIFVNAVLCFVSFLSYRFTCMQIFKDVLLINLIIGMFNLLPVRFLDGGRAAYYLMMKYFSEEKTEKISMIVSAVIVAFLVLLNIGLFYVEKINFSLIIVTVYLIFLLLNHIFELKKI